jgi:hypothetical protein
LRRAHGSLLSQRRAGRFDFRLTLEFGQFLFPA